MEALFLKRFFPLPILHKPKIMTAVVCICAILTTELSLIWDLEGIWELVRIFLLKTATIG